MGTTLANNIPFRFVKNRFDAVEEIRRIVGFSEEEFHLLFELLNKSRYAHINFEKGNMDIEMTAFTLRPESGSIDIKIEVKMGKTSTSIKHELSKADLPKYLNHRMEGK